MTEPSLRPHLPGRSQASPDELARTLPSQSGQNPRYAGRARVVGPAELPIVLGRYELHSIIATGGMASIHLGRLRGPSGFARTVAIKRLHPHFARDPTFVSMFMDEARLVARIRHPNVVPILDVVAEQDELFLVMEYVHGGSLARLVDDGQEGSKTAQVPPPIAAAIFADVLHGLHAAHEAKSVDGEPLCIVHRDVTPHNVLVGIDGSSRIADFGIAKATRRDQTTQAGVLKGKLCYVAPEQLQGQSVSPATDVYAAAVSLWEALTGRMLFEAEHEAQIMQKILTGVTRAPSALVQGVPPELDEVVMRGLEMKPSKRFASAREMALALEKSLAFPSSLDIGAWVSGRAQDMLAARVQQIESIERMPPLAELSPAAIEPVRAPPAAAEPPPEHITVATMTHVMSPPGEDVQTTVPMRRTRAPWVVAIALLAVLSLGGGTLLVRWRFGAQGRAAAPEPHASTATPASTAMPPPSPPTELAPIEEHAPPPTTNPEPVPSAPKHHSHPHPAAAVDAGVKSAPADMCNPPYTRDESGAKIYKRECL